MVDDNAIIDALRRYGHLKGHVKSDMRLLTLKDKEVIEAVRSYQDFCIYPLNSIVRRVHGRELTADGDVGPATRELFARPRCEIPDFGPGSGVDLQGSGSWPASCQKSGIKMFVDLGGCPVRDQWPQIQADVLEAYRLIGLKVVPVSSKPGANVHVYFRSFFGGTIGLAEFNGQSCSDEVFCSMSTGYRGENRGLFKHEFGHNCNLSHTRGGTMNPYIITEPHPKAYWQPSDPSYQTLVRYFDGVPVGEPGPGPQPTPPPPPDDPDEPYVGPVIRWIRKLFGW